MAGGLYVYNYGMVSDNKQEVDGLAHVAPRSSWVHYAACSSNPAPFQAKVEDIDACRAICSECPVRQRCLEYAVANEERWGVWGGLTYKERKAQKSRMDVSRVPLEFRDHYLQMEGRVKRSSLTTPHYVRNPNLDLVIDPDFLALIDAL